MQRKFKDYFSNMYSGPKDDFHKLIVRSIEAKQKLMIVTANPETLMTAMRNEEVSNILLDENISICPDGISIVKASRLFNFNMKERITGVELTEYLLKYANDNKKSLYIFGTEQIVLDKMIVLLEKKYPNIIVLGLTNGYVNNKTDIIRKIIVLEPDICLIALGIPHQEKLIYKHFKDFKKGILIGVGGSIDVISGYRKRAPVFLIKLNLEWLYRIITEPKRIKRFCINNINFIIKIRREAKNEKNKSNEHFRHKTRSH